MEKRQFHLPNLDIQPIDYMKWQKKYLTSRIDKQREFWKRELDGAPSEIDLSLGHPQLSTPSERGHRVFLNITDELFVSLRNFCQRENFTSFEVLMTAFSTLAHIFSNEDEISIGTVVAGRKHSSIEHVIGNFANVVVVRNDISGDPTLYTLLERLRSKMVNIIDNSDIPFDEVVSAIQPNRNRYKNPLFNIFLSLYNGNLNDLKLTGLQSTTLHCDQEASQFDLSLAFFEAKSSLEGYIEYKIDLFDEEGVKRIVDYYIKVLRAVVDNPKLHLGEIPLVDIEDQNILVNTWNDFHAPFPHEQCLHQLFEDQVQRVPNNIAITFDKTNLTYAELNQKANQVARYLRQIGITEGDLVGMCVKPSAEMIVGLLGIAKAGAAYVPLDPELPNKRINFII
jgi:non-ribosomal peptide synthetase component F